MNTGYREFLRSELVARAKKNSKYSLRAFARDIGLQPSLLSEIISGKRALSLRAAEQVAERLDLTENDAEAFRTQVQLERARSEIERGRLLQKLKTLGTTRDDVPDFVELEHDQFQMIAEWYHLPLLELAEIKGFELTSTEVSKMLGITRFEALDALERLVRLGHLTRDHQKKFRKARSSILIRSKNRPEAMKAYHDKMLQKAAESVRLGTPQDRVVCSWNVALEAKDLPKVEEVFVQAMKKLSKISDESQSKDQVFHLEMVLFPVSKRKDP